MSRFARTCAGALVALLSAGISRAGEASTSQPLLHPWPAPLSYLPTATNPLPAENLATPVLEPATLSARVSSERVAAPQTVTPQPLGFVAIAPCRQYDSRNATPLLQATTSAWGHLIIGSTARREAWSMCLTS
jgi:hypothetical protein